MLVLAALSTDPVMPGVGPVIESPALEAFHQCCGILFFVFLVFWISYVGIGQLARDTIITHWIEKDFPNYRDKSTPEMAKVIFVTWPWEYFKAKRALAAGTPYRKYMDNLQAELQALRNEVDALYDGDTTSVMTTELPGGREQTW